MNPITREPHREESGEDAARLDWLEDGILQRYPTKHFYKVGMGWLRNLVRVETYDGSTTATYEAESLRGAIDKARGTMPVSSSEAKPNGVSASPPNSASPSLQIGGSTKALEEIQRIADDLRRANNPGGILNPSLTMVMSHDLANQIWHKLAALLRAGQPDTQEQKKEESL